MKPDIQLVVRAAWLYYKEGLTQQAIADRLGLTRLRVNRFLRYARERGFVHIDVRHAFAECLEIESELQRRLGLKDTIIIPALSSVEDTRRELGRAAANLLMQKVGDGCTIGVTWGITVREVIRHLQPKHLKGARIVEFLGGVTPNREGMDPHELANRLAEVFGAECYGLNVPFMVDSPEIKASLLTDRTIQNTMNMVDSVDIGLVGIGDVSPDSTLIRASYLSQDDIRKMQLRGAVGNVGARFFDVYGEAVPSEWDDRILGVELRTLRRAKEVIGVAGGLDKVLAIAGAARGHYVTALVTDVDTATRVLAEVKSGYAP